MVEISEDGIEWRVPILNAANAAKFDAHVMPWEPLFSPAADRHKVPRCFVAGTIYQESLGDAAARSKDGGLGLMQITARGLKQGHSDDEIVNEPALNIELGTAHLGHILQSAHDLPATASMYNAGSPCILDGGYVPCGTSKLELPSLRPWSNEAWLRNHRKEKFLSRWGFCCSVGYIDSVVRAANYYLARMQANA